MNIARFILSALAGFIFIFGFDFAFHGQLLMPIYEQTPELWRPPEVMQEFFLFMMLGQFLLSLTLAYIFTLNYEGRGIMEGVRFGLPLGFLIGALQFTTYAYMPISIQLALMWAAGSIVQVTSLGVLFALIYKDADPRNS